MTRRQGYVVAGAFAAGVLAVWLLWPYIVGAGVLALAWRVMRRDMPRRRRPKSSWSSLGRTAALMFAAWNSRWLKPTTPIKARVPAAAGREHAPDADELRELPF